jgi:lipoyl(octanoyl) transferase
MRHIWLGTFDYVKALELQENVQQNAEDDPAILGLEHPLTITLGRRGDPLKDVLVGFKTLREKAIPVVAVDRGGQASLHHPGQLVIYPIVSLRKLRMGARRYVEILEDSTKQLLARYGITACCRGDEPGLYTLRGKIAAFGVRISRGVTSHGVAINVKNNLQEFAMIRSCGKSSEQFSRMFDFGVDQPLQQLFAEWVELFQRNIEAENLTLVPPQDTLVSNIQERV